MYVCLNCIGYLLRILLLLLVLLVLLRLLKSIHFNNKLHLRFHLSVSRIYIENYWSWNPNLKTYV